MKKVVIKISLEFYLKPLSKDEQKRILKADSKKIKKEMRLKKLDQESNLV